MFLASLRMIPASNCPKKNWFWALSNLSHLVVWYCISTTPSSQLRSATLPRPTPQSPTPSLNLPRKPSIVNVSMKKMGPPSLPFSTHHSKPSSQTRKSQSRNSCPPRSLPQSRSFLLLLQKAPSFIRDPPPPYSPLSSPPSYACTSLSTSPLSSPPITRRTYTPTFLAPYPAPQTPTTTPTNIPSLFRTVRMFGLYKRSLPTETSYVLSPASKTS